MRLLHISDLHASTLNERDQRSIVDAMLLDVQKLSKEMPFDAVIFSGDLAFSGKSDDYELASEILLEPLAQTLSLERSRIVLIPGNHDVDFDAIEEYFDRGLSEALTDREAVNKLLSAPSDLEKATARLMGWRTFCDKYYADVANVQPAGPLAFVHTIETDEGMLGIAALNSAWRSSEGNDKGRLLVGETQASSAIDAVAECDVRVAIVHHPLDWLAAFDGDALRTQLEGAGLLVLTGHEHEADPISTTSARGGIVQDRAGCLYQSHNYPNSYSVVDLAPRDTNVIVCVREWYPERSPRGVFDEATRLAEGGKVALTLGSHVSRGHPPYSEVISALTALVQDHSVIFDTVAASDQQTIDQLLVPPRLFTVPYQEGRAARESTGLKAPDPLAALAAGKVVVICGDSHEDGVTSTLLWLLASQYQVSDEHFPAYLASGRSLGTRDGDNMLSAAAAQLGLPRTSDGHPDLVAAIDDVDDMRPKRVERLAKFISENRRHRFVIGTHGNNHAAIAGALESAGVDYLRIFVWPFGTRQLRGLVSRVDGKDDDVLVQRVSGLIRSNRLPRSPFIMAALIAVLRAEGDLRTINESSVLTAYANLLLGGIDVDDAEGLGQDYRRREYLLGCIAKELLQSDDERMTRYRAECFVTEYFGGRSYTSSPVKVLQSLIDRHVLMEDGDRVGFRHRALLYLFAGHLMNEKDHQEFRADMIAQPFRFAPVIQYAAGLARNDKDLLESIGKCLDQALSAVTSSVDTDSFDRLLESREQQAASLELLRKQLAHVAPQPDDDETDRFHDIVGADDDDDEPEQGLDPITELAEILDLLTSVLRSSEFVDDNLLKSKLLKTSIAAQSILGAAAAGFEDETHVLRDVLAEAISIARKNGEEVSINGDVDHFIRSLFTVLMLASTLRNLGSPYLGAVVREGMDDADLMASPTRAFLMTVLACFLELSGWATALVSLYNRFSDHPYLKELVRNLATGLYRHTDDNAAAAKLERFLIEIYAEGVDARTPQRSQVQTQLQRGRQRARMGLDRSDTDDELDALPVGDVLGTSD